MNVHRDHLADSSAHLQQVKLLAENRALRRLVMQLGLCPDEVVAQLSSHSEQQWKWDCMSALHVSRDFSDIKFTTVSVDDANAWLDQLNLKESS